MSPIIPYTPQQQLARRIKSKRKMLYLSQLELAKRIKTSQTAIARLEAGQSNPTLNLVQRLVTVLDLELTLVVRPQKPENAPPAWLNQA